MFIGYDQQAGRGWSKDLMLVDWEELDEASHMSEVHVKGITAEEVEPVLVDELFVFHMAEGFVSQPNSLKFSKDQKK